MSEPAAEDRSVKENRLAVIVVGERCGIMSLGGESVSNDWND